jgi:Mn-containing catalase
MYHHVKNLMYDVNVGEPDVRFGRMLLEQFGGANGELAAAMQYTLQGWSCDDPERRDLLMDIGTEEISHLEVVGALIRMHFKPMKKELEDAEQDPLVAVVGGGGLNLFNSMAIPGPPTISRSPASSTSISAITSPPKRAQKSPTSGSCTSQTTGARKMPSSS